MEQVPWVRANRQENIPVRPQTALPVGSANGKGLTDLSRYHYSPSGPALMYQQAGPYQSFSPSVTPYEPMINDLGYVNDRSRTAVSPFSHSPNALSWDSGQLHVPPSFNAQFSPYATGTPEQPRRPMSFSAGNPGSYPDSLSPTMYPDTPENSISSWESGASNSFDGYATAYTSGGKLAAPARNRSRNTPRHLQHQYLDTLLRSRCPPHCLTALNLAIQWRDEHLPTEPIPNKLLDELLEGPKEDKYYCFCCPHKARKGRTITPARDHVRKSLGNFPFKCTNDGCQHTSLRQADLNKHIRTCGQQDTSAQTRTPSSSSMTHSPIGYR